MHGQACLRSQKMFIQLCVFLSSKRAGVKLCPNMASMQDSLDSSLENPLFPVARALARSKIGRTFVSLLTLAIFAGLAYFAFHHRDFTAQMSLIAHGANVVSAPSDSEWGRRAVLKDFDGHTV